MQMHQSTVAVSVYVVSVYSGCIRICSARIAVPHRPLLPALPTRGVLPSNGMHNPIALRFFLVGTDNILFSGDRQDLAQVFGKHRASDKVREHRHVPPVPADLGLRVY